VPVVKQVIEALRMQAVRNRAVGMTSRADVGRLRGLDAVFRYRAWRGGAWAGAKRWPIISGHVAAIGQLREQNCSRGVGDLRGLKSARLPVEGGGRGGPQVVENPNPLDVCGGQGGGGGVQHKSGSRPVH